MSHVRSLLWALVFVPVGAYSGCATQEPEPAGTAYRSQTREQILRESQQIASQLEVGDLGSARAYCQLHLVNLGRAIRIRQTGRLEEARGCAARALTRLRNYLGEEHASARRLESALQPYFGRWLGGHDWDSSPLIEWNQ